MLGPMTRQATHAQTTRPSTSHARKMRPAFYDLHSATLDPATTPEQLAARLRAADAVPERHRLSEGAVYSTACRRYLLDTGTDWKAQAPDAAVWTSSDHRYRERDGQGQCSCGERVSLTDTDGTTWHAAHTAHAAA